MGDVIDRAEAALEGVTEGPWEWDQWGGLVKVYTLGTKTVLGFDCMVEEIHGPQADIDFIAAARQLVPELVAELKTARAQLKQAHDALLAIEARGIIL